MAQRRSERGHATGGEPLEHFMEDSRSYDRFDEKLLLKGFSTETK